jgi:hypothetical protein
MQRIMIKIYEEEKNQIYCAHWQEGHYWLDTAQMLKSAADKILKEYSAACRRAPVTDPDLVLYCPYMLLMGYAVENALKGMIICESGIKDSTFKGKYQFIKFKVDFVGDKPQNIIKHDLLKLIKARVISEWCDKTFNNPEMERVMKLLHGAVLWSGKYPAPTKYHPTSDDPSQTAAAHPAAEQRGMRGAAARLIEIK